MTNKVIYVLRFCLVLHVILFAQKLMEVIHLPKLMDSILFLMGYHDNITNKICSGPFMLLITKHEMIAQKYRFFFFLCSIIQKVVNTFDLFCLVIKCIARGITYVSFMKIYGADLFPCSKEAIFTLKYTQHLICLEALNSSKLQNLAK